MSREHVIDPRVVHHDWDETVPPLLEIESGDVIHFDLLEAGNRQVKPGDHFEDVTFDFDTLYNLSGPVTIAGAEPGDTLAIDVLNLEHGSWGWTAILPGFGLLPDDFPEGYLRTFDIEGKEAADFGGGITVPLRPFMGVMGVQPGGGVRLSPFPPHAGGGNIDNRHLIEGSRLYLPVFLPGALFSCGDPHAVQGDGEVCVSALEGPLKGSLRLTLLKRTIPGPAYVTAPRKARPAGGSDYCTMGIASDLMEGSRMAARAMVAWLGDEHGLEPRDAYMLCSLAGNLKILEVVDAGMWNVGMCMPLSIFPESAAG
jgi:acetamidase/formamidase